ncbi:hypothetical protein QZH41_004390 [Actinostola sp. cb2023]|nr:hypothetical protein QZH41_004390 [Actinostola sp. cb2023]
MCTFTMLTRLAYYHVSPDDPIDPKWVIISLKASIILFVSGFLVNRECRLDKVLEDKDILSRGLLDFVDIFDMVELLSLNECVGVGSSVTEESSLEKAIQAFCTLSFLITFYIIDKGQSVMKGFGGRMNATFEMLIA